jgi:succinoglycan biosynthesis protein ExoM
MKPVVVIVPTFRRPDSLSRALTSVLAQEALENLIEEIAVVDNDPAGSAHATVQGFTERSSLVRYLHAPEPGVSNARNLGLAATAAPLVAFLDDDEEASPHWLSALHTVHMAEKADVTFGPVRGRADQAAAWKRPYLEAFFSRTGPAESGPSDEVHGCGNSMMTRASALAGPGPFDLRANETGGEDDRLFERLQGEDRRFAWAAEAWVWEHAPVGRQTVGYALSRGFGYGQTPAQIAARAGAWSQVAKWMLIGAGQGVVFAVLAALATPFGQRRALAFADRAARGFGKLFWFRRLRFYGQAAARRDPASTSSGRRSGMASRNAMATKITHSRSL